MVLETALVAVGSAETDRLELLESAVRDIAGPAGATVVLGHAFTESELAETAADLGFEARAGADPDRVTRRLSSVRELGNALSDAGIEVAYRGQVGEHGPAIVELADEVDADLLFVGGRKRSPTGKAVFGSTAQEVMLNAPCPVTFVRG